MEPGWAQSRQGYFSIGGIYRDYTAVNNICHILGWYRGRSGEIAWEASGIGAGVAFKITRILRCVRKPVLRGNQVNDSK